MQYQIQLGLKIPQKTYEWYASTWPSKTRGVLTTITMMPDILKETYRELQKEFTPEELSLIREVTPKYRRKNPFPETIEATKLLLTHQLMMNNTSHDLADKVSRLNAIEIFALLTMGQA